MHQDSDHLVSSLQARIGNRVANCEMVDDLSQLRGQAEISVHLVVKKRSDACRSQAKRFGSKIHSLTNSTCFEMHISISTIAVTAGRILKIADHRECQASVTCQLLAQTESGGCYALIPLPA